MSGLNVARLVLDTNIILYFLGGRLADPLPAGAYAISVISELELLAYPGLISSEEQRVRDFHISHRADPSCQTACHRSPETLRPKAPGCHCRCNSSSSGSYFGD
jgi:hypothetical protein